MTDHKGLQPLLSPNKGLQPLLQPISTDAIKDTIKKLHELAQISYAPTIQVDVVMGPTAASDVSDEDVPYLPEEDKEQAVETDWDIL